MPTLYDPGMDDATPWFADGLRFACTQCGKCCTGEPGFVWVTDEEVQAIAKSRGEPLREFVPLYTREARGRRTLREKANGECIFYDKDKGCTVYRVRPRQCRTWPFWESNVESPETWQRTMEVCPGSGQGELIPVEEILRRVKVVKL
ncbi:MAG TPA: YkgJ family cysteine cluster protein [Fimbriiglobus sp.]|nr:YkgJ family cysteine cluster protein [Fimbriiglobus sp.]